MTISGNSFTRNGDNKFSPLTSLTTKEDLKELYNEKEGKNEEIKINKAKDVTNNTNEILYNGDYYDVSEFMKRHPGGEIIQLYSSTGEDATNPIQQFHHRSIHKVFAIMKTLPKRKARDQDYPLSREDLERHQKLTQDFNKLYKDLQEEGYFDPDLLHVALRFLDILVLSAIGTFFFFGTDSLILQAVGVFLGALAGGRGGWMAHEASHRSFTGNPKLDNLINILLFGALLGVSGSWWVENHSRHHAMPQNLRHDTDLKTLPLIAFHKKFTHKYKTKFLALRLWLQNQAWLFLLCDTFFGILSWKIWTHPKYCLKHGHYLDLFMMASHHATLIPLLGPQVYLVMMWMISIYILGNITLSHTHLEVSEEPKHWVEYSLSDTVNVKSSYFSWVDYWMGMLNYQVEHHLFPSMPQYKNKLVRERVKQFAKEHNLPYRVLSYWDAVKRVFHNLNEVSKHV